MRYFSATGSVCLGGISLLKAPTCKAHYCNEMESVALRYPLASDLQDYIGARCGGPGKSFFRIATSSTQARAFIEDGKMAVVFDTENEKVVECGEYLDQPLCTRQHIGGQVDLWYALGLRDFCSTMPSAARA